MIDQSDPCPFDAREREFIRREFGVHFGQPSYLADGILLRTWRSGPEKNQPKLPAQAIYEFAPSKFPAFVGQQVDVFIQAPTREAATRNPTAGQVVFGALAEDRMQTAGGASGTLFTTETK